MNGVPVANQGEDEQQKSDQEQAEGFSSINRVPAVLGGRVVLALRFSHANYCTPHGINPLSGGGLIWKSKVDRVE